MGKWLMVAGGVAIFIGALLHFAPQTLSWFGRLPGDIRIDNGSTRVFIPFTSMLIVSVLLSVIVSVLRR